MGNLGWSEMLLIMVFALVVFGPQRLPEIARQVGKAMREIRRVSGAFEEEIRTGLALDDKDSNFPFMKGPSSPVAQAEAAKLQSELPANSPTEAAAKPQPQPEPQAQPEPQVHSEPDAESKPEAGGEAPGGNVPV